MQVGGVYPEDCGPRRRAGLIGGHQLKSAVNQRDYLTTKFTE
jgi:hypothetical protein